jgi:hypothetical protein
MAALIRPAFSGHIAPSEAPMDGKSKLKTNIIVPGIAIDGAA